LFTWFAAVAVGRAAERDVRVGVMTAISSKELLYPDQENSSRVAPWTNAGLFPCQNCSRFDFAAI
jgi:hypothetical protein